MLAQPAGRATAIFALAFFVLFDCGRAALHARAIAQLESRLWDSAPPLETAALPSPFNPFRWTGIVETPASYQSVDVNALAQLNVENARTYYKPADTPAIESAKRNELFRYFLYFARFPVWSVAAGFLEAGQGTRLDLSDLRFGVPGRWILSLHCARGERSGVRVLVYVWPRRRSWLGRRRKARRKKRGASNPISIPSPLRQCACSVAPDLLCRFPLVRPPSLVARGVLSQKRHSRARSGPNSIATAGRPPGLPQRCWLRASSGPCISYRRLSLSGLEAIGRET